jgi:hypothetical protein
MIGSIKLHDDLVVLMPPKLHQVNEPRGAQILNHLLQLRLLKLTKCISINALRLHNRWLPLLEKLAVEDGLIVVKVKKVLEAVLKEEILLILSKQILASHGPDASDMVAAVDKPVRSPTISRIRSKLGLPHTRKRAIKWNKVTDKLGTMVG